MKTTVENVSNPTTQLISKIFGGSDLEARVLAAVIDRPAECSGVIMPLLTQIDDYQKIAGVIDLIISSNPEQGAKFADVLLEVFSFNKRWSSLNMAFGVTLGLFRAENSVEPECGSLNDRNAFGLKFPEILRRIILNDHVWLRDIRFIHDPRHEPSLPTVKKELREEASKYANAFGFVRPIEIWRLLQELAQESEKINGWSMGGRIVDVLCEACLTKMDSRRKLVLIAENEDLSWLQLSVAEEEKWRKARKKQRRLPKASATA